MKSGLRRLANKGGPPVPVTSRAYRRGLSFDLGAGRANRETHMRAYTRSGTVYSIVSLLQQAPASARWHLYLKARADARRRYAPHGDQGSDQRREVVNHAALQLWERPNEFHSRFEFNEGCNQHLELAGETFWVLNREVTTFPTAMWYIRPDRMEPVPDPQDYLTGWIYNGPNGEQVPLKLDEVILEKLPDPLDPFRGTGPVAAVLDNIQQQDYATQYQRNLFLNGADPGGIITVPGKMSDRDFDELVERWREMHQGVARAGRVGLLENGAQWSTEGQSNKDLEYGNLRLANRDELREAWRIHKAMLGTVDDVNRANAETAQEIFASEQKLPRLERRRDTLNHKLLPMFGPGTQDRYEFDFENPLKENAAQANAEMIAKATAAQTLIAAGFDAHAVLEWAGLPDMPWSQPTGGMGAGEGEPDDKANINSGRLVLDGKARESIRLALPQAKKDPAAKVIAQAARDYPPAALAWMYDADWSGPVKLPADYIEPDMQWLDSADPHHVQDFVRELRDGNELKPGIAVMTPGAERPKLVDGHHRWIASDQEGVPFRVFVGRVSAAHGPWETMHDHQDDGRPHARLMPYGDAEAAAGLLRRILGDGYVPVEFAETGGARARS